MTATPKAPARFDPRIAAGLCAVLLLSTLSCQGEDGPRIKRAGRGDSGSSPIRLDAAVLDDADVASDDDASVIAERRIALMGTPFPFNPTPNSFSLNAVSRDGPASDLRARVRHNGADAWNDWRKPDNPAQDVAQWRFRGLEAGKRHDYQVAAFEDGEERRLYRGSVVTQREEGREFSFALITDTHIEPRPVMPNDDQTFTEREFTLQTIAEEVATAKPDFIMNLGDMLDFHLFGFNLPPPDGVYTKQGYLNYRRLLGDALGEASHFVVIGNWDGENGDFSDDEIQRSREQRLLYAPGPEPDTYPQGGSEHEDYYAFTWGDALFVVLNVMTYTPTSHLLSNFPGEVDDWTLGEAQLDWLRDTLEAATSKWRFVLIHHAVGGEAGNAVDAAYGRGGGQAANVGEQKIVHQLMREHGVQIFFYGHDHVFTDMVVDDIHYTLPGSAGAPWKFVTAETGYEDYWPNSGHARVHVSPLSVEVEFVALGGEVIYNYTLD